MFSSVSEIVVKLLEIAEEMGFSSHSKEVVTNILRYIQFRLDESLTKSAELEKFEDVLRDSSTAAWINEENLFLFCLFLMCRSFEETAARFSEMSEKSYESALQKIKELSSRYCINFFLYYLL